MSEKKRPVGASKSQGIVSCPKCGRKGYLILRKLFYYPKTRRFNTEKRTYTYKCIIHYEGGRQRMCTLERMNPIYEKKVEEIFGEKEGEDRNV